MLVRFRKWLPGQSSRDASKYRNADAFTYKPDATSAPFLYRHKSFPLQSIHEIGGSLRAFVAETGADFPVGRRWFIVVSPILKKAFKEMLRFGKPDHTKQMYSTTAPTNKQPHESCDPPKGATTLEKPALATLLLNESGAVGRINLKTAVETPPE
jgi:hypothetical protein